jgi:hypothetical protein
LVQEELPERQMHRTILPMKEVLLHCQIWRFDIAEFADSLWHRAAIGLITKRVTNPKAYEMGQR